MRKLDAIFAAGVFRPLSEVTIPENQRVRLTIELVNGTNASGWMESVRQLHQELLSKHGVFPDSTPDIAADRRRDETE